MTTKEKIEIQVEPRQSGKGPSRQMRLKKQIPAILYGAGKDNVNFCLPELDATRYMSYQFDSTIFTLKSADSNLNGIKVLRKDFDFHPVNRKPVHMDFMAIDMKKTVRVNVELKFEGKSKGEAEGGLLTVTRNDVEIECLPTDIPNAFVVDVTEVDLNGSLHVSDLQIPENVKVITALERTICTVAEVKEEPAAVEAAPAEGEASAEGTPAEGQKAAEPAPEKKDS